MVMECAEERRGLDARRTKLLAAIESAERRFDAAGTWSSRWARTLARAIWLRGRFFVYILFRLGFRIETLTEELSARSFWGAKLALPTSDLYAVSLYCFRMLTGDDVRALKFIVRNLGAGGVFYDVGANYGFYGLLAREIVGASGEVHLFEPVSNLAAYLRKNFAGGRGKVFINETAVSDSVGQAVLYEAFTSGMSGESTLLSGVAETRAGSFNRVSVPSVTLDEYRKTHAAPTFLKIDAEGAEDKVLAGAEKVFKARPVVLMEAWYPPAKNESHKRAVRWLLERGYKPQVIRANGELLPVADLPVRLESGDGAPSRPNENFVFLP